MAEQAAIGQDVIDFADALGLKQMALAGYDWGGRAAAIAAALHPDRVRAAVMMGGYLIQNIFAPPRPAPPEVERELWYQWYFMTERGRAGLAANHRGLCKLLWQTWSPGWHFSDEEYNRTAPSFDNPDFVDVVIHSYRHRNGAAPGDPRFEAVEHELAKRPQDRGAHDSALWRERRVSASSARGDARRARGLPVAGSAPRHSRRRPFSAAREPGLRFVGASGIVENLSSEGNNPSNCAAADDVARAPTRAAFTIV